MVHIVGFLLSEFCLM